MVNDSVIDKAQTSEMRTCRLIAAHVDIIVLENKCSVTSLTWSESEKASQQPCQVDACMGKRSQASHKRDVECLETRKKLMSSFVSAQQESAQTSPPWSGPGVEGGGGLHLGKIGLTWRHTGASVSPKIGLRSPFARLACISERGNLFLRRVPADQHDRRLVSNY